jgi:hypothetical protein
MRRSPAAAEIEHKPSATVHALMRAKPKDRGAVDLFFIDRLCDKEF